MTTENRCRLTYIVADYLSTNIAVLLFNIFRYYDLPSAYQQFNTLSDFLLSIMPLAGQALFPLGMMLIYYMSGAYSEVYLRSRASELLSTIFSAFIGTLILIFVALINDLTLDKTRDYAMFIVLFLLLFGVVYIPRLILTVRNHRWVISGEVSFPTLIVGYGSAKELFRRQCDKLLPRIGMRLAGLIDYENGADGLGDISDCPVNNFSEIRDVCTRLNISQVIVIPHPDGLDRTLKVIAPLYDLGIPVYIAADGLPGYIFNKHILNLRAEPYIDVTGGRLNASTMCSKRVADICISALALAVVAIPVVIMGIAVKIDSRGPMFYRQRRVGRNKREFNIIKLRTMHTDSEADGHPALSHPGDQRVTRLGRVLRKYRLDELPQFFNVLRGDMSLVGPRPERPHFTREILQREPAYTLIHRIRPGITSLGMVKYGYASTIDDMVRRSQYDLLYLENVSIVTDLKIMLYTARTVLTGKGV